MEGCKFKWTPSAKALSGESSDPPGPESFKVTGCTGCSCDSSKELVLLDREVNVYVPGIQ